MHDGVEGLSGSSTLQVCYSDIFACLCEVALAVQDGEVWGAEISEILQGSYGQRTFLKHNERLVSVSSSATVTLWYIGWLVVTAFGGRLLL